MKSVPNPVAPCVTGTTWMGLLMLFVSCGLAPLSTIAVPVGAAELTPVRVTRTGCAVAEVDMGRLSAVRESFPALAHRTFAPPAAGGLT